MQGLRGTLDIRAMLLTSRRSSWINDPGNASSLARLERDWVEDPGDALSPERLKSIGVEDPREAPHPREEWRQEWPCYPEA